MSRGLDEGGEGVVVSIRETVEDGEPEVHASSFRVAVAQARGGTRGSGPISALTMPELGRQFEVRRVKRRGKDDVERWNALGRAGWELVAVAGKHAYFRRELLVRPV